MLKEYSTIKEVYGPLVLADEIEGAGYEELVEVILPGGGIKMGRILELSGHRALIQLFESAEGLNLERGSVRLLARGITLKVSPDIVGRMFDGLGNPIDGAPQVIPDEERDVNGLPINPYARDYPSEFIETGISAIDGLNTLVRGQKLPVFSGSGLPHSQIAAQIARQARVPGEDASFAVVFAAMGITFEEAGFFMNDFRKTGAIERAVMFINLADDPAIERIATPRLALAAAEYMAFELDMHVLVILTDMTNYCESLREISAARREVPGRRGYPGYMYTDLATMYERAGRIKNRDGSITQIPILTMPEDDKTHPIPDLTGYITEGQIVLDRDLHKKGIYPPIDVLPSLSRLRDKGIGENRTRADHANVASQLFASYARGKEARELAIILGEAALTDIDRLYYNLADVFEETFLKQDQYRSRTIEETLRLGWEVLAGLPEEELKRIKPEFIKQFLPKTGIQQE